MACFGENEKDAKFFPEELLNFFWLQHPEFLTKVDADHYGELLFTTNASNFYLTFSLLPAERSRKSFIKSSIYNKKPQQKTPQLHRLANRFFRSAGRFLFENETKI
jgi:hypothetical protein